MTVYSTLYSRSDAAPLMRSLFKAFTRQDHDDDDTLLASLLQGAVEEAEAYIQQALTPQKRLIRIPGPPPFSIQLDFGPWVAVEEAKFVARDGTTTVIDEDVYWLEGSGTVYASPADWGLPQEPGNFYLRYACGVYTQASPPAPTIVAQAQTAIFLLTEAAYNRSETTTDVRRRAAFAILDTLREGQGV